MNILVTGGAGYIGTHTLVELLDRGHDVVVVDNYVNSHPESLDRVREITGKTFPFYEANVCDEAALDRIFDENKVDCVIHFAGLKAVGESCAKPLMYYRNNLDGMLSLISSMRKHDVKRIVFSSSATVYRGVAPWLHQPLWLDQVHGRGDPARRGQGRAGLVCGAFALLQPHRRA